MRGLNGFGTAVLASLFGSSLAIPLVAPVGGGQTVVMSSLNTVNTTHTNHTHAPLVVGDNPLAISVTNNIGDGLNAYITGNDINGAVVILAPDGTFFYPSTPSAATPVAVTEDVALPLLGQGQTTQFTLPDYVSSARIWVAQGELSFFTVGVSGTTSLVEPSFANPDDPSVDINWGFVELTNIADGIYANLSFVDFVGMVMGMALTLADGTVQTVKGLASGALAGICADMKNQTAVDGQPWGEMCVTDDAGNPLRVLSPNIYVGINPGSMDAYWNDYINQVWDTYTTSPLTIVTQSTAGNVDCTVVGDLLTCAGDNRGYAKPTAGDIFGCNSGPFASQTGDNEIHLAVIPRLCAAFTRGTLLLPGGNVQPSLSSDSYYTTAPSSFYAKFVHEYETDGLGYAFSYDDVNPADENSAGVVAGANPTLLALTVG